MWKRRKLKRLREEVMSIDIFNRLYEDSANPTEAQKTAHLARQNRRNEVLSEIERLAGLKRDKCEH